MNKDWMEVLFDVNLLKEERDLAAINSFNSDNWVLESKGERCFTSKVLEGLCVDHLQQSVRVVC